MLGALIRLTLLFCSSLIWYLPFSVAVYLVVTGFGCQYSLLEELEFDSQHTYTKSQVNRRLILEENLEILKELFIVLRGVDLKLVTLFLRFVLQDFAVKFFWIEIVDDKLLETLLGGCYFRIKSRVFMRELRSNRCILAFQGKKVNGHFHAIIRWSPECASP